jgi:cell division septation protein DedD
LKPAASRVDQASLSWNLSWQPEGRCNSFSRESIFAYAPPTSGVYGLFNFDCQILIGESANIREALLSHESETDFQSPRLRPTGFTFEPCAAELRKAKADELIARFRPVLQAGAALGEPQLPSDRETEPGGQELGAFFDQQEFPAHEHEKRPTVHRRFRLKPAPVAAAAMLILGAAIMLYRGTPADHAVRRQARGADPVSGQAENSVTAPNRSSIATGAPANRATERTPGIAEVRKPASTRTTAGRLQARTDLTPPTDTSEKWSVQVAAVPTKDSADALLERLKAKGYQGYVVQAQVKGQTYHRVRIGRFQTREQAESARQSLMSQEGYRDAYLADD